MAIRYNYYVNLETVYLKMKIYDYYYPTKIILKKPFKIYKHLHQSRLEGFMSRSSNIDYI